MKNITALNLIRIAQKAEISQNFYLSDKIASLAIRLSQDFQTAVPGQELKPGEQYIVDTSDQSVFDNVAKKGVPETANVGGVDVLITHGSPPTSGSGSFFLVPEDAKQKFIANNPDFTNENMVLSEADESAGIKAVINNENMLMLNTSGMQKYVGTKWISCYDTVNGPNPQAFFKSKGEIGVSTITDPSTGQQKTILQQMP